MRTFQQLWVETRLLMAICLGIACSGHLPAQTSLNTGDIAFTGYNGDNPDDFSFVLLKDVVAGTTITFTDRGWQASGGFRPGEGALTITFAANRITGEQFRVPGNTGIFIDFSGLSAGSSTGTSLVLSSSGDQVLAYQGAEPLDNSPAEQSKFLAAIQMNGAWDSDASNENTSSLPPGLSNGVNALAIDPQVDNARYNCSVTGPDIATLRAAIHNPANWLKNDNTRFALPAPCDMTCGLGTDRLPPLVICPFIMEDFLNDACDFTIGNYLPSVITIDNCTANVFLAQSPAPGTVVSATTPITVTARDAFNNTSTCSFELFLTDTIPPQILSCPGNQTGVAGRSCLYQLPDYTHLVTASDNCDPLPLVLQNPVPGTLVSQNTTIVITVQDAYGNERTCSFQLTLVDTEPPNVLCTVDQIAFYAPNCTYTVPDFRSYVLVSDECDPFPQVQQFPPVGSIVSGDTQISFKISDASGNNADCNFNLILYDVTPPTLLCQNQYILPLAANCQAVMPDMRSTLTLYDNCDPNPTLIQFPPPGQNLTGNTFAVFYALDASNNFNFCISSLILRDITPPSLTCRPAPTIALQGSGTYTLNPSDLIASMSDNCGPVTIESITPATLDCQHAGQNVPVTITVRDAAGNQTTCTTEVFVNSAANLAAPWASSMVGNNAGGASFDNCGQAFTIYSSGSVIPTGASDAIQFVYRPLCGDGEIIARVSNIDTPGASAGIMMRETLQPGSKKAAMRSRTSNLLVREVREMTNAMATTQQFSSPHRWLRLVRNGNTFTGYSSSNGANWEIRLTSTIIMGQCVYVGVFVESINAITTATARVDNVSVTGALTPLMDDREDQSFRFAAGEVSIEPFPNPASDQVFVQINTGPDAPGQIELRMQNKLGQEVWRGQWQAGDTPSMPIPLQGLPAGVYIIQARAGSALLQTAKLVVQR